MTNREGLPGRCRTEGWGRPRAGAGQRSSSDASPMGHTAPQEPTLSAFWGSRRRAWCLERCPGLCAAGMDPCAESCAGIRTSAMQQHTATRTPQERQTRPAVLACATLGFRCPGRAGCPRGMRPQWTGCAALSGAAMPAVQRADTPEPTGTTRRLPPGTSPGPPPGHARCRTSLAS